MIALLAPLLLAAAVITPPPAVEVRRLAAEDAHQGVVSDGRFLYAIDNAAIARIDPASGKVVARWEGDKAHFKHMNSCIALRSKLVCAASNYPDTPHISRVETFDTKRMKHLDTHELGAGYGSLTWLDWHDGSWWATYANYDGKGGMPGRDHRATTLVRYDRGYRELHRWTFPESVLERFAPRSSSGGAWAKDGLLYVTGHDRPELYALRVPATGDVLEHVATIAIPTNGQAIAWDPKEDRLLWSIERKSAEVVASRIPPVLP